jgi:hypothetical protein
MPLDGNRRRMRRSRLLLGVAFLALIAAAVLVAPAPALWQVGRVVAALPQLLSCILISYPTTLMRMSVAVISVI